MHDIILLVLFHAVCYKNETHGYYLCKDLRSIFKFLLDLVFVGKNSELNWNKNTTHFMENNGLVAVGRIVLGIGGTLD